MASPGPLFDIADGSPQSRLLSEAVGSSVEKLSSTFSCTNCAKTFKRCGKASGCETDRCFACSGGEATIDSVFGCSACGQEVDRTDTSGIKIGSPGNYFIPSIIANV